MFCFQGDDLCEESEDELERELASLLEPQKGQSLVFPDDKWVFDLKYLPMNTVLIIFTVAAQPENKQSSMADIEKDLEAQLASLTLQDRQSVEQETRLDQEPPRTEQTVRDKSHPKQTRTPLLA